MSGYGSSLGLNARVCFLWEISALPRRTSCSLSWALQGRRFYQDFFYITDSHTQLVSYFLHAPTAFLHATYFSNLIFIEHISSPESI